MASIYNREQLKIHVCIDSQVLMRENIKKVVVRDLEIKIGNVTG